MPNYDLLNCIFHLLLYPTPKILLLEHGCPNNREPKIDNAVDYMIKAIYLPLEVKKAYQLKGHKGAIYKLIDLKESGHFLSVAGDGYIVKWPKNNNERDGRVIASIDEKIFSVAMADEKTLLAGTMSGKLYWIDIEEKTTLRNVIHHRNSIFDIKVIGSKVFTVSGDGLLSQWNTKTFFPLQSIKISDQGLRRMTYNAHKKELIIGSSDNSIYFVNVDHFRIDDFIRDAHDNSVFCLSMINENQFLSGGRDAQLNVWDRQNLKRTENISAHWFTINDICFIPGYNLVVTASRDKTVRFWHAQTFELLKSIDMHKDGHINSVNTLLWCDDNQRLYSAGDDRSINVWEIK